MTHLNDTKDEKEKKHPRHTYHRLPIDARSGYRVVALPTDPAERGPGARASTRVAKDRALELARAFPDGVNGRPCEVLVEPCDCGEDALSVYADEHPRSVVVERVRHDRGHPGSGRG